MRILTPRAFKPLLARARHKGAHGGRGSGKSHFFHIRGKKYGPFAPGTLRDSIYQVFSKSESTATKAAYQVSWNYRKAPYAFMVELGTSRTPAKSFLGKALREKKTAALQAIKDTYIAEVGKK